ncbi:MAG: polyphosphate:AMP phosphotransferase [Azoarcus sp.]|jgi:polyphosphate:AMP phosphotransferase|nr:polyphosphate:AMP phosphotransferase [Azoarcus sp.]
MFESAELGHTISRKTFRAEVQKLREALLEAQFELREKGKFQVIVLVSGGDGAGKGETTNDLYSWMDPRYLFARAFSAPTEDELAHPFMWRFWQGLPPKGRIGIFSGSWYSRPIHRRIIGEIDHAFFDQRIEQINRFEAMLANEGALILKFWLHLTKEGQKKRFKALEKDPRTAWRVTRESWGSLKTYDKLQEVASHMLRMTNTSWAPWVVVESANDFYRSLTVGKLVLDALQKRLSDTKEPEFPAAPPLLPRTDALDVLTALDLNQHLERKTYQLRLARALGRISEFVRLPEFKKHSLILVFEGSDAAGKGGTIKRLSAAFDARQYQIMPTAAPTQEELAQPYLWRFWRHVPKKGRVAIFDRSWYGRVLVERVEGFCLEADWLRAYTEINDFEHELMTDGAIILKFWLQISMDEQLKRFQEREATAFKRYKITDEDWRNREKWDAYHDAVCDMVERTSTGLVPWTLVEANDKQFARVKVLETVCARLEKVLLGGKAGREPEEQEKNKTKATENKGKG